MTKKSSPHTRALLQAFLVTFLWSTSWVLIKNGLQQVPPLLFSGMRYTLAFLLLLVVARQPRVRAGFQALSRGQWGLLVGFGLIQYALVQGAFYIGLAGLPAATVGLLLNFTSVLVALFSALWLEEKPGRWGWMGVGCSLAGAVIFFYPASFTTAQWMRLGAVGVAMLGNAAAMLMGRHINHRMGLPPLQVTTVSMGAGGLTLLAAGLAPLAAGLAPLAAELALLAAGHALPLAGQGGSGIPELSWQLWVSLIWLALVNTALAFSLWNRTQRTLSAVESSLINNTMLVQIALLAWLALGETPSARQWLGMLLAVLGVAALQLSYLGKPRLVGGTIQS